MLSILSWNIRQGGGTRISKISRRLIEAKSEIIVLSEFQNNSNGAFLRANLLKAGYIHQGVGHTTDQSNTVLIASRLPCDFIQCNHADPVYTASILHADFGVFHLYGMYLPHKKKHQLFDFLKKDLLQYSPSILVGDFNTGKQHIDQKGNSFMYSDELDALEKMSYVDAFRRMHGSIEEYSWYSHQGNGYRYDHSYMHNDLIPILKDCHYIHAWREEKLSDHSPMIVALK